MHKVLESQVTVEKTVAQKEIALAVHKMVRNSGTFCQSLTDAVVEIQRALSGVKNPLLQWEVDLDIAISIVSAVIANGYGNLCPLQSIAARVVKDIEYDGDFETRYHLALELVAAIAQVSEYVRMIHSEGTYYVVSEYKNKGIDTAVYNAAHPMPCLIPPKAIVDIHSNAYRSESGYKVMLGSKHNVHEEAMPVDILNYLSGIAYSVEATDIASRPAKIAKPKHGRRVSAKVKEQIAYNSKLHTSGTAKTLQYLATEGNKFYFAHSFDKRIRAYSKGYQINLQGDEYDKSVLEFNRKIKLTSDGFENLLIATANAYGLDKLSFTSRIMWCYEHMDTLEQLAAKADEPLFFAKCVRAIRAHRRGEAVGIPMHIDATASGLQINGCLLACRDTLAKTNAIGNAEDKRMDIYTEIYDFMRDKLPMLKDLTRKEVKDAAVPAIYASEAEPKAVFDKHVGTFWQAFEQMHGAYWYLKCLPQLWRDDITEYSFTLPDGYRVYVPVIGDIESDVFVECLGEDITITQQVIGRKKKSKCFLANITHALDAYVLRNIVRKCRANGIDIMCIHDSFNKLEA